METLPRIVFSRILLYATSNKNLLKKVFSWERVSKIFAKRLMEDFWINIRKICIRFFSDYYNPFPMVIRWEEYESIDLEVLGGLKQRGIMNSVILFLGNTPNNFLLQPNFADCVPSPVVLRLGNLQNLNDPEILRFLGSSHKIEEVHFYITNPSINNNFIDAIVNLKSVKQLTLWSFVVKETLSVEKRKALFAKLDKLSLNCLFLISKNKPDHGNIFCDELFSLLENKSVKCLHLAALNHYVERWLAAHHLHHRAEITNLCIVNYQFGYNYCESENKLAPLFHSLANYLLLFPKLKYLCIGICLARIDDNRLDSMLLSYYLNNTFDIKLRLTVRLFHKLKEIPFNIFDSVLNKLKSLRAEVQLICETKTDATITIKSMNDKFSSEIIICFDSLEFKGHAITNKQENGCVDLPHHGRQSVNCLCVNYQ